MKRFHRLSVTLLAFAWFTVSAHLSGEHLKPVRVIEDSDQNIISVISDATLTQCKDIIILDRNAHTVSRYGWDGTFINKIGRQGAGPGDFSFPDSVCFHDGRIYIHDSLNNRLVETDEKLGNLYIYPLPKERHNESFLVLDGNAFIFGSVAFSNIKGPKVCTFTKDGSISGSFFEHTPVDLNRISPKSLRHFVYLSIPAFGLDQERKRLLIAFKNSDNPIKFYLYDLNGKCLATFDYRLEEKYKFHFSFYQGQRLSFSLFKGKHLLALRGIYNVKGNWYVFFTANHYPGGDYELTSRNFSQYQQNTSFYLKFSAVGAFLEQVEIKPFFHCLDVSPEGYVLGVHQDSEIENLTIYKLME